MDKPKAKPKAKRPASGGAGAADVEKAVMGDAVVKAAIRHSGSDAGSDAREAQQSEIRLKSEGQRSTSMLWELTQKEVALSTVRTALAVAGITAILGAWLGIAENARMGSSIFLYGVANLVIGFYFGRTNHTRTGGPGGDSAGMR